MWKKHRQWILPTLIGLSLLLLVLAVGKLANKTPPRPALSIGTEQEIADMRSLGLLKRIDLEQQRAWVDPRIWRGINAQTKENVSAVIAYYIARKTGAGVHAEIFDNQSAKKLASYSKLSGFEAF
jgi:hypothetical protein